MKVIDFGLAVRMKVAVQASNVMAHAVASERDRSFTGTFDYAAPEQKGKFPGVKVGPYSDVFSFGKTCLMALFGTTEVKALHWKRLPADLRNTGIQELLELCTIEELTDRWKSFAEVLVQMEKLTVDPKEAEKKAENLKRWKASPNPRKWLETRLAGWNHEQWQRLLEQVKTSKFWPLDEAELGRSLEETRLELLAEREQQRKEKERHELEERDRLRKEKERKDKEEQERQAEAERQTTRSRGIASKTSTRFIGGSVH